MAFSQDRIPSEDVPTVVRRRLSLGRTRRRLSFEWRLRVWIVAASWPLLAVLAWNCRLQQMSLLNTGMVLAGTALLWWMAASYFFESVVRPLQTLSNIVASLRENDFSFRARGARRGDALGDLALEINALASTLQQQRSSAMDALALADRVMTSMQSPVIAFDSSDRLRLLNTAAERAFSLQRARVLRHTAADLGLGALLQQKDEALYLHPSDVSRAAGQTSWSIRRAAFRLYGVPHTLFVLSDVAAALQEEERIAWQRIIRVLGHEINNSLTPIKSIASMLRTRPLYLDGGHHTAQDLADVRRGLSLIEDRADSLNRFLQAYQQLSRLPQPSMQSLMLRTLIDRVVPLERRVLVHVLSAEDARLLADPDQLEQMLINLIKNAADAALDPDAGHRSPHITLQWTAAAGQLTLRIEDNGPGLTNPDNLFVPFYTTKPDGAGIGLTLSRQIAAAHRGSLHLCRRQNGAAGCVAEIILPLAP